MNAYEHSRNSSMSQADYGRTPKSPLQQHHQQNSSNGNVPFKPVPPPKPKNYRPMVQGTSGSNGNHSMSPGQWESGVSISSSSLYARGAHEFVFFFPIPRMDRRLEHIKMVFTIHPHRHTIITKCNRQRHQVNHHIMDHQLMRTVIRTTSTAATETVTMAAINRSRHMLPAI